MTLAVDAAVYSLATPGVNAPNTPGPPSVSDSVAGTVPATGASGVDRPRARSRCSRRAIVFLRAEVLHVGAVARALERAVDGAAGQDRAVGAREARVALVGGDLRVAGQRQAAVERAARDRHVAACVLRDLRRAVDRRAEQLHGLGAGRGQRAADRGCS